MGFRLIHTSDWHLGHTLRDMSREEEQGAFLDWLLACVGSEQADALVVTGDLFDTSNPSAQSQRQLYGFLAELRRRHPQLSVVLIGGNHDSGARLDAPEPLLSAQQIHMIGCLPWRADRTLDLDRLLIPLRDRRGEVAAWIAAVPFLRDVDLPQVDTGADDPVIGRTRVLYGQILDALQARRSPGQALILTGHAYVRGGAGLRLSPDSERRIQRGYAFSLPAAIFPPAFDYVALGHMHCPQEAGRPELVYSGAPYPLGMDEDYAHRVVVADFAAEEGRARLGLRGVPVPRRAGLWIWPDRIGVEPGAALVAASAAGVRAISAGTAEEAEAWASGLPPRDPQQPEWCRPFLEMRVRDASRTPALWERLSRRLRDKAPRLVRLHDVRSGGARGRSGGGEVLERLNPEEVFKRRWRQEHPEGAPPPELLEAFHRLVEQAEREGS